MAATISVTKSARLVLSKPPFPLPATLESPAKKARRQSGYT